jgi:DNA-directed RNA polymerase subunit RPC12/RpoP
VNSTFPIGRRCFLVTMVVGVLGAVFCAARLDAQGFRPGRPTMPNIPPPPNLGGPGNPRMPNGPQPPMFERVWTCSHCGAELGRGVTKPQIEKCPKCGTRFINGTNPFGGDPQPPNNSPAQPPTPNQPPIAPPWNPPAPEPPAVSSSLVNSSPPSTSSSSGPAGALIWVAIVIGILVVTALCLAGFVVLVMWIVKSASRPVSRRPMY